MRIDPRSTYHAAFSESREVLSGLLSSYEAPALLELGGGRRPAYRLGELPGNVASYTVNDLSDQELSLLPEGYHKARFDVCGDVENFAGKFDVIFSHFLAEHVPDGRALHRNVYEVLRPGGVAFHVIPTLFASPFVVNSILPEKWARELLIKFFPTRRELSPKFPAFYSYCQADTKKMRDMFASVGYSKVAFRHFYGHPYYEGIPVVREIENFVSGLASKRGWKWYTSYAYITAYK